MWVYDEEDESLDLDIGMIKKFAKINITAPVNKSSLEQTLKDLNMLKAAFEEKGDEEREEKKRKFLREQSRFTNNDVDDIKEEPSKYRKKSMSENPMMKVVE
jgi:hypothetical protein